MGPGLVVYDMLYLTVAGGLYAGSLWVTWQGYTRFLAALPWPLAAVFGAICGVLALILAVALLTPLFGPLRAGRHPMLKGRVFYAWIWRSLLRRVIFWPGLKWILFSSNVLRFLTLRALGARVSFTTQCSTDVELLDPSLLTLGPGATLGTRCMVSCHIIEGQELILKPVVVHPGALLSAEVLVGPGVEIGERAVVHSRAALSFGVRVGARAVVGPGAHLHAYASVEPSAKVAADASVRSRARVVGDA